MFTTLKAITIFVVIYCLIGVSLLFSGISSMQEKGLPPFNDGLVSAVWSFPSPPRDLIEFFGEPYVSAIIWSISIFTSVASLLSVYANKYRTPTFTFFLVWSTFFFVLGIWTWIFGLLN